ncbi:MAG: ABC transporter substrate-binding protein [Anaerolineae bacterium]|jgi:NitT/TauT family transport system substrate-binding protein|nr:ABC transporter substrate-binding protein [Anaerolineae bacterium]
MKKIRFSALALLLLISSVFLLGGCEGPAYDQEPVTLRIGVLPILDILPLYVAEAEGYFTQQGVQVELVPISSAAERDQLMQAGQIDGIINDLVSIVLYNKETPQVTVVRYAMQSTADYPQFRILAAPHAGLYHPDDLRGITLGVSEGTVIQYVTERLLAAEGIAPQDFDQIAIPKISDRMALLESGELQAATLPEPLGSLALQKGATVILEDSAYPEYSCSVMAFRKELVLTHPEAVRGFLAAIDEAIRAINADKSRWSTLLIEKELLPQPLIGNYALPDYPTAAVPSEAQFADVLAWAQEKGLITGDLAYTDSITPAFLP